MCSNGRKLDDLATRLHRLAQAVARLRQSLDVFEGFYRGAKTPLLENLPEDVGAFFLPIVRDAFTDSIVVQIGTLLDRNKQAVSIDRFLDSMAKQGLPNKEPLRRLEKIRADAASIIEARNNLVAHTNQAVALGDVELQKVTFEQAKRVANDLASLVDELHEVFHGSPPTPLPPCNEGSDALEFLVECIELRRIGKRESTLKFLSAR